MTEPAPQAEPAPSDEPSSRNRIARNALVLSLGTLASRILGMGRETLIAATFDVASTDAWFLAWRIPAALRGMLAEGPARYIFNPVLGDELHSTDDPVEGRSRMRSALARARGIMVIALGVATALGMIFARPIFRLMAGRFHGSARSFELGVDLLRTLFPFIFFMGWFAVGNSALQLLDVFRPGAFAPLFQNVAFLALPYALFPVLRLAHVPDVESLAISALVGGALQVLWIRPALRREGMLPRPVFANDRILHRVFGLFLPELYAQGIYQLNIMLSGRFLSSLPAGSASFFSYAQRLADIPQGLFSVALSGAAAAAMQRDATRKNREGVARTYESSLRMAAFVAVPLAVILSVYGRAVVPVIFGYGHFRRLGSTGLDEIAASLRWQALGIGVLAFVHQTTAVFGAFAKRRAIVLAATASMLTFLVVGWIGARTWGHVGVAVATASSSVAQLGFLLVAVRREIRPRFSNVGPTLAKVLGATGVSALCARFALRALPVTENTVSAKVLALTVGAALVGVYLLTAWVLRCDEMIALGTMVRSRLRRNRT